MFAGAGSDRTEKLMFQLCKPIPVTSNFVALFGDPSRTVVKNMTIDRNINVLKYNDLDLF